MPNEPTPDDIKRMSNCKRCGGLRYVLSADGTTAEDCQCLKEVKYRLRLESSGIPPLFQELEFSNYIYAGSPTDIALQEYLSHVEDQIKSKVSLFLYGKERTGKSMLASLILKDLIRRGYSCSFMTFSEALENSKDEDAIKDMLSADYQFSCIDDITDVLNNLVNFTVSPLTDTRTNGAIAWLKEVVTSRARNNVITILTSLVPVSTFEANPMFKGLGSVLRGYFQEIYCVDRKEPPPNGETSFKDTL